MKEESIPNKYAQVIHSNNYLKMHRIPMRRKKSGTRKTKRFFYMDEASMLFRVSDTQDYFQELFKRARTYIGEKNVTAVKQKCPLPSPAEELL